jgi:hypothetical protein
MCGTQLQAVSVLLLIKLPLFFFGGIDTETVAALSIRVSPRLIDLTGARASKSPCPRGETRKNRKIRDNLEWKSKQIAPHLGNAPLIDLIRLKTFFNCSRVAYY